MYIEQGYALYLGQDAKTVPAVGLFDKWMKKVDSKPNFEIESVYGWASAEMFAQALKDAGNPPTRSGLVQALNKVTFFDAGGLVPPERPRPGHPVGLLPAWPRCRTARSSAWRPRRTTGFYCGANSFLKEPGYTAMVRPTS